MAALSAGRAVAHPVAAAQIVHQHQRHAGQRHAEPEQKVHSQARKKRGRIDDRADDAADDPEQRSASAARP